MPTYQRTAYPHSIMHRRLHQALRKSGYSVTIARRMAFNELLKGPITAATLAGRLSPAIDRATTYRTIGVFEKVGIVNRVIFGQAPKIELSEIFLPHHHHAVCARCNIAIDMASPKLERLLADLAKQNHFLSIEHSVELRGYCGACHDEESGSQTGR
ncbi:MAG: transcriptional repressor [Candidatus Chaera renei]|uniref:Transcriptional repressor n=1 Tax=Candidatus Chaera renei TaxID=2506947 RepID=A0A4Q0AHU0_9BACT|nr:MAG: transcriptional repressor [Candidatus Chaera renei]